jgi:hypothetical protein
VALNVVSEGKIGEEVLEASVLRPVNRGESTQLWCTSNMPGLFARKADMVGYLGFGHRFSLPWPPL